jgi:hypothetical protein
MENWKRALLAGSAVAAVITFVKGKSNAGIILSGIALATLASEYPDEFAELRDQLPRFIERGTTFLSVATRVGGRLAEAADGRGAAWYESLLHS